MEAEGDAHDRGNAVLVATFLGLPFCLASFFFPPLCGEKRGVTVLPPFLWGAETHACDGMESPPGGEMVWRGMANSTWSTTDKTNEQSGMCVQRK
jgi:hypothetical protein